MNEDILTAVEPSPKTESDNYENHDSAKNHEHLYRLSTDEQMHSEVMTSSVGAGPAGAPDQVTMELSSTDVDVASMELSNNRFQSNSNASQVLGSQCANCFCPSYKISLQIMGIVIHLLNILARLFLAVVYTEATAQLSYGLATFALVLVPGLINGVLTLIHAKMDNEKLLWSTTWRRLATVLLSLCLCSPIVLNILTIHHILTTSRSCCYGDGCGGRERRVKASLRPKQPSNSSQHHKLVPQKKDGGVDVGLGRKRSYRHQPGAFQWRVLRLAEACFESVPQITMQLYIIASDSCGNVIQVAVVVFCLISCSIASRLLSVYPRHSFVFSCFFLLLLLAFLLPICAFAASFHWSAALYSIMVYILPGLTWYFLATVPYRRTLSDYVLPLVTYIITITPVIAFAVLWYGKNELLWFPTTTATATFCRHGGNISNVTTKPFTIANVTMVMPPDNDFTTTPAAHQPWLTDFIQMLTFQVKDFCSTHLLFGCMVFFISSYLAFNAIWLRWFDNMPTCSSNKKPAGAPIL